MTALCARYVLQIFDFSLTKDDMNEIVTKCNCNLRVLHDRQYVTQYTFPKTVSTWLGETGYHDNVLKYPSAPLYRNSENNCVQRNCFCERYTTAGKDFMNLMPYINDSPILRVLFAIHHCRSCVYVDNLPSSSVNIMPRLL